MFPVTRIGRLAAIALLAAACQAQTWTLERLYTRPYIWGTPPQSPTWAKETHTLVFRWNPDGGRFMDLFAYHADEERLVRLTDLEGFDDKLLHTKAEKDERRRMHLPPRAGIRVFDVSRDGKKVAFVYRGELFLVPTDGSAEPFRLTRTKTAEGSPKFSPDGKRLFSVRGGQVVRQDLATGQLWQVTDVEQPESLTGYWPSPDGTRIAYRVRRGKVRRMPLPNYSGRFVTADMFPRTVAGDEMPASAIYVIGARGRDRVRVDLGEWKGKGWVSEPVWSEDSSRLAVRLIDSSMKKLEIRVADPLTGKSKAVWKEEDPRWVRWNEFGWSPDSKRLWIVSEKDGWAHLYTVPAEGGEPVQVTRGEWEVRPEWLSFDTTHEPQWIGEYIYYPSTEEGTNERHFYRIRPDGTGKERLSWREGVNCGVVSEDGRYIAFQIADLENPADLYVGRRRVTRRTKPEFADYPWPETRFVRFPSRGDRRLVAAKMLLPPGYDPDRKDGKKWPAVFFIHGAGYATSVLKQWGSYQEQRYVFNSYLANRGYVIIDLDYRGSSGYGRDWRTGVYLHMGGKDLEDVLGAVDYLRGLGNIDMERIGIWGVSYGGFMTNMAMFLAPDAFRAGSSWASVNDWENYNAYYTGQRLNTPARNPEAFRRSSPITFSRKLKGHLLIVHGMVDNNVLFQDAVQLAEKLIKEGKPFGQAYYPEESHAFVRDETWIDACRRTVEWFDRYLKGGEE